MAWDYTYIHPKAQEIFDSPEEEQGRMVNRLCIEYEEKLYAKDCEIEELKKKNKELKKTFDAIIKTPAIQNHINNCVRKQKKQDDEYYSSSNHEYIFNGGS